MRQERQENGTFKASYASLGETVVMRIPRSHQKFIKDLLSAMDEMERQEIDSLEVGYSILESFENNR